MKNKLSLSLSAKKLLRFFIYIVATTAIGWVLAADAGDLTKHETSCSALAETKLGDKWLLNPEYDKAMKSIAKLPEYSRIKKRLMSKGKHNTIQFHSALDHQYEAEDGKCYWQVSVHENWEDENRFPSWHSFLVDRSGRVKFVTDLEGNYISLHQWRSSKFAE